MDGKFTEKFKEGVSTRDIEDFARKYITEIFGILTIVIATASSCWNFFLSGPKMALLFTAIGAVASMLAPESIDRSLKRMYLFIFRQPKSTQIILGSVKVVIALFIPFIIFGLLGLLAGSAYHHYLRAQSFGGGGGGGGRMSYMEPKEEEKLD